MSISSTQTEIETATMFGDSISTGVTENVVSLEAPEDRELHAVTVSANNNDTTQEVSFSNSMEFEGGSGTSGDSTASGVVAYGRSGSNYFHEDYGDAPPMWHAGEELNLHVDNASGSATDVQVLIQYLPVGEFQRDTLRNTS